MANGLHIESAMAHIFEIRLAAPAANVLPALPAAMRARIMGQLDHLARMLGLVPQTYRIVGGGKVCSAVDDCLIEVDVDHERRIMHVAAVGVRN